jgi:hypothetical protein
MDRTLLLAMRLCAPAASTGLSTARGNNYLSEISANKDGIRVCIRFIAAAQS